MGNIRSYIDHAARIIEAVGVLSIVIGGLAAFLLALWPAARGPDAYKLLRQRLGKSILLGLEILVAADIIATVVTQPTMGSVLTLAVIVLIRTFLSLSLEVEIEGRFPWQRKPGNDQGPESAGHPG